MIRSCLIDLCSLRAFGPKRLTISGPERHFAKLSPLFQASKFTALIIRPNLLEPNQKWGEEWFDDEMSFENVRVIDDGLHPRPTLSNALGYYCKNKILRELCFTSTGGEVECSGMKPARRRLRLLDVRDIYPYNDPANSIVTNERFDNKSTESSSDDDEQYTKRSRLDFTQYKALEVLRISADNFFNCVALKRLPRTKNSTGGFEQSLSATTPNFDLLPPKLTELVLRFKEPYGIFAQKRCHMMEFRTLPETEQLHGFDWILGLLQIKTLRRVTLIEEHRVYSVETLERDAALKRAVKFTPPEAVVTAFKEAEVELDIYLLDVSGTVS